MSMCSVQGIMSGRKLQTLSNVTSLRDVRRETVCKSAQHRSKRLSDMRVKNKAANNQDSKEDHKEEPPDWENPGSFLDEVTFYNRQK